MSNGSSCCTSKCAWGTYGKCWQLLWIKTQMINLEKTCWYLHLRPFPQGQLSMELRQSSGPLLFCAGSVTDMIRLEAGPRSLLSTLQCPGAAWGHRHHLPQPHTPLISAPEISFLSSPQFLLLFVTVQSTPAAAQQQDMTLTFYILQQHSLAFPPPCPWYYE